MRLGTSVCFDFWNIDLQKRLGDSVGSKLRNLYDPRQTDAAVRATVNGRKAVAYVKNGKLQAYEYLDDLAAQCCAGPCLKFEDGKEKKRM